MKISKINKKGFSLIEILLVVVIIGAIIAVILPRAWRANVDAKYNVVRQAGAEVARLGNDWAEKNLQLQADTDTSELNDYLETLEVAYTGDQTNGSNWTSGPGGSAFEAVAGRAADVEFSVADTAPSDKPLTNPFNGLSYFSAGNDGTSAQPGLLFLAEADDGGYSHYYLIFTASDATANDDWYAGMDDGDIAGLRNGIFMARVAP